MNNNNKNNGIKANKAQQIKLVDIDVKQAKKDIDEITKYADKKFSELKNKIGNIGFNGGVSPISFASPRSSNSGGSSLAQSANRPAYTGGKTASIGEYFSSSSGLNFGKIASSLNGSAQARYEAKEIEKINNMKSFSNEKVYKDVMKNLKGQVKTGELTQDAARKLAQSMVKKDKIDNLLSQSADKFSKSGTIMQAGAKIFTAAATTALNLFKAGSDRQTSVYESTYTNVAVRTQLNQSDYRRRQMGINDELRNRGLSDNVRSSDVMQSWSDLADRGLSLKDIDSYSMDDVITKKLVPYLDTMSNSFLAIQNNLGLDFTRNIRGITKSVQETAGSSRFTVENLNDMIAQLEPMSIKAKEDLVSKNATEMSAYIESLLQQGEITTQEAQNMKKNAYDLMYNQSGILENGSPAQIMSWINMQEQGIDPSKDGIAALQTYTKTASNMYKNVIGDNNNGSLSGLFGEIVSQGIIGDRMYGYNTDNGISAEGEAIARKAAKEAGSSLKQNANNVTNDLANNKYDTNRNRQEITMENLTNEFSALKETLGYWGDIIKVAIDSVLAVLTVGMIGKGISALTGVGGASSVAASAKGLLGAAGPIALGIGAVVGAVALGNELAKKNYERDRRNMSQGIENHQEEGRATVAGTPLEDNQGAIDMAAATEGYNYGRGDWKTIYDMSNDAIVDNWWADTTGNIGNFFDNIWFFDNPSKKDPGAYNKWKLGQYLASNHSMLNNERGMHLLMAYHLLLRSQGISDGDYNWSGTDENLKDYSRDVFADTNSDLYHSFLDDGLGTLGVAGIIDKYGEKIKPDNSIEIQETMRDWGSHRLGLDYVPYDNYPALLHQGEAVLEQNTANQLRHMISKYEDSEQQSVNFREAIQEQTRALVERLDAILSIMSSENTNRMVANEMARIQSPTDANIINMVPVYSR